MAALLVAGCGSSATSSSTSTSATTPSVLASATAHAHPQALDPVAGQASPSSAAPQARALATVSNPLHDGSPNAPASVTSAPAAGAPSDAEVRAAVAQFKAAVARYHLDRLNLNYALLDPSQLPPGQYYVSIASVFTDYGLPVACGGVLHVAELGVANKTLPCGTMVTFVYNGRAVRVPVIDRGPYIAGREWDLTGATAEVLHFPGLGPIYWRIG